MYPQYEFFREGQIFGFGFDKCNKVALISPVSAVELNCWLANKEITLSGATVQNVPDIYC